MSEIFIPKGQLANDADLAAKRKKLKEDLLNGRRIPIGKKGTAGGKDGEESTMVIPDGKLADDATLAAKRAELKRKLLEGGRITLKKDGGATGGAGEESSISIPTGKLASQWYEFDPELLEMEKAAMARAFNGFSLGKLDDGRLYWIGDVTPGVYETKFGVQNRRTYTLMAVYQNNHPHQQMGSSVYVYPISPDVDELIDFCGFRPSHLLLDTAGERYLCTAEADNVKAGTTITTAASVIAWAVKWLTAYELVLTGELSIEKFNEHHGI